MILSIGEILADMVGKQVDGQVSFERKAGGAPFNVACGVAKFGGESGFIGCVGDDLIGDFLTDFAKAQGLSFLRVDKSEKHNTTLAFVELSPEGERSFCFYRKNTADYQIIPPSDEELSLADIVHVGSLMLHEEVGFALAKDVMQRAKKLGKKVSFDVNFRSDIFRDQESAVSVYRDILPLADIIKLSEDEVEIFTETFVEELAKERLVLITCGAKGSVWHFGDRKGAVATISVKPVDTTGAGDAFYAGVLSVLDGKDLKKLSDETLYEALRFGNVCGALCTLGKGAIEPLPTRSQIQALL